MSRIRDFDDSPIELPFQAVSRRDVFIGDRSGHGALPKRSKESCSIVMWLRASRSSSRFPRWGRTGLPYASSAPLPRVSSLDVVSPSSSSTIASKPTVFGEPRSVTCVIQAGAPTTPTS
jgi:hypothetical protein